MNVFWPRSLYATQVNGKQYALPYMIGGTYVAYNADMFDQAKVAYPPTNWNDATWTWSTLIADAQKLTKHTGGKDQWGLNALNAWAPPENVWWMGGDFADRQAYEQTGIPTKIHLACPQDIAGIQLYVDAMYKYKVAPPFSVFNSLASRGDPFMSSAWSMNLDGLWVFSYATNAARKFRLGFGAVPHLPGASPVDAFWSDPLIMGSRTKHPQEVWKLITFLTSPAAETVYINLVNWPSSRKDSFDYWVNFMAKHTVNSAAQLRQLFNGSLQYGRMSADLRLKWYQQLNQVWTGDIEKAYLGQATAKQALTQAQNDIVNTYQNHQVMVSVAPCNDPSFDSGPIRGH
jgi:multiple sugar transport system substrate-binding protein